MGFLLRIDRRLVFLLLGVAVISTTLISKYLPETEVVASKAVTDVYAAIETLEPKKQGREHAVIVMSMDFDPASGPELEPMTRAMLRHMFTKQHKVVGLTHWPAGLAFTKQILDETVREFEDVAVAYEVVDSKEAATDRAAELRKEKDGEGDEKGKGWAALTGMSAEDIEATQELVIEELPDLDADGSRDRALRAEILMKKTSSGKRAVVVPGLRTVTMDAGGGLSEWHPDLHKALAQTDEGKVVTSQVAGGKWAVLTVLARKPYLRYGEEYCFLGQKPGIEFLMVSMGQSIYGSFPTDTGGRNTRDLPILKDVPNLREIDYLVTIAAGDTGEKWIQFGSQKFGFEMSVGCTAVMAPDLYPYHQAEQIDGIVGAIRGAWEYEMLTKINGEANKAAWAQSAAHLVVILLILACNLGYFLGRKKTGA